MGKLNYLMVAAILLLFAACEKTELAEQKPETKIEGPAISVQHGMLVFDSQESFDKVLKMVEALGAEERKAWEESLGFKSYDRLIGEIMDAEIALSEKYESLPEEEQQKFLESGDFKRYSGLAKRYMKKGIVKISEDKNGGGRMDFPNIIYSNIVNEDGMVAVGNNIYQYTEEQFKYLKSRDFSKIDKIKSTSRIINNNEILVTNIKSKNKSQTVINTQAISHTVDRKKIVLRELYNYYGPYSDGTTHATYKVDALAERKNWLGSWIADKTSIWLYGHVQVIDNITNPRPTFNISGQYGDIATKVVFDKSYPAGHPRPTMATSISSTLRSGGSNGIGVRMDDHDDNNPVYLP